MRVITKILVQHQQPSRQSQVKRMQGIFFNRVTDPAQPFAQNLHHVDGKLRAFSNRLHESCAHHRQQHRVLQCHSRSRAFKGVEHSNFPKTMAMWNLVEHYLAAKFSDD